MTFISSAGKRAHSLAFFVTTLSLLPFAARAQQADATVALPSVDVTSDAGSGVLAPALSPAAAFYQNPPGQVTTTIPGDLLTNTKAFSVFDVLRESPGVSTKQGNGPRDIGISIRGSGAQVGFGIRNVVIFEDGFPVTQPDGLSRTDLTDPHAYGAIDVIRGPSSALYGNYATGGALNFRLRSGGEINGLEVGTDAGSFGYLNNYLAYGKKVDNFDVSLFSSNVVGNGPTNHNLFNTQTVNLLGVYTPTPNDKFTVKVINNTLYGDLSVRLNLNQFYQNPYQVNCYSFPSASAAAAAACGTNALLVNGFHGATVAQTAYQSGLHRDDTRTIVGLRWEHDLDANSVWRTQVVVDDKNYNQPTGATTAIGNEPAINIMSDITSRGTVFGLDATHFVGAFLNTAQQTAYTYNVLPGGNGAIGSLTQYNPSQQTNMGLHGREEIKLVDGLSAVGGLGAEYTHIGGVLNNYTYDANAVPTLAQTFANQNYYNIAPEGALLYRPGADWLLKARIATGYGTPQASNLFVLPTGLAGNNTQLKSQTNLGYDLGVEWTPTPTLKVSVDGFYEFFHNELISQSPGPSPLMAFTFNAPRSEHRGVEVAADWRFLDGWNARLAYTYDNQIYTQYTEQLSAGTTTRSFNRAGNRIPGVAPNELTARLGYDLAAGPLKGLGAYAEYYMTDSFFADNGNLLKIPGYRIVNLNLHYDADVPNAFFQKIGCFFEVRNVFNETYVASANNVTNTINAATGAQNGASVLAAGNGTLYAGFPRTFVGGVKVKF